MNDTMTTQTLEPTISMSLSVEEQKRHAFWLKYALRLAQKRRGFCAPNPSVGAVLVKQQQKIAEGVHWQAGAAHAEIGALQKAGSLAKDAILYVTLEPCCHFGKTPPCVDQIIKSGIRAVYYAYVDPNPLVGGKGADSLQKAGIVCQHIPFKPANDFYDSYRYWLEHKRPWVTFKMAMSLDGKIAGAQGESVDLTLSIKKLQRYTHHGRKCSDGILTTINTVQNDDPKLMARLGKHIIQKPIFLLDTHLQLSPLAKIIETGKPLVVFHKLGVSHDQLQQLHQAGVRSIGVPEKNGRLDLHCVLNKIGEWGIHDLWIEAGGTCLQSFIKDGMVQRLLLYVAPHVLGPKALPGFPAELDVFQSAKQIRWSVKETVAICDMRF